MEKISIIGKKKLSGQVRISGAKNAAVAIIPAVLLSDEVCRIDNVPNIRDVTLMANILKHIGVEIKMINKSCFEIDARNVSASEVTYDEARHMRASCYLLGALLGRFHQVSVPLPGGCDFGVRPIDQHLKGFSALNAESEIKGGVVNVKADRLIGNNVYMDVVSVGATINIILAAVKAEGVTVIENAAKEPHIVDLANFLNSMGAEISGAGTDSIKIKGVKYLKGTNYSIIPDQIEAGTYMAAAVATGGDVLITNVTPKHLESITAKLQEIGAIIDEYDESIRVRSSGILKKCNVKTMPHPGFPTDMQPQITALLSLAEGTSIINESVWDNRFRYIDEINRMGSKISVDGKIAVVEGVPELIGTNVRALDLRAGAALVIAGLAAKGTTVIEDIQHIERGYENIIEKLSLLGANIKKIYVPEAEAFPTAL